MCTSDSAGISQCDSGNDAASIAFDAMTVAHEMGHNFNMDHGNK